MNLLRASAFGVVFSTAVALDAGPAAVALLRTPDGGIQPQAVLDREGFAHLIYYKGDPKAGDIFYVRQQPGNNDFSAPIQVNQQAGSAIAIGTIRGAQLAVGKKNRAHVAWNGTSKAKKNEHAGAPMLYARLNDAGTAFEPERDLVTYAAGLDGGGSVAADDAGNVFVTWHAQAPDGEKGEAGRAVFVARSTDDGQTFSREQQASPENTGACGCCGMRAYAGRDGSVFMLFRAAMGKVNRDEILLASRDGGASFKVLESDPWVIASCPMSSATITESKAGVLAAWETAAQVHCAVIDSGSGMLRKRLAPEGVAKRKHPVAVGNQRGEVLLAWIEGSGWQKGGAVAWQLFDESGKPTSVKGRSSGAPAWSLATAYPKPDGSFVIVY
jgi:hypothetical protein